MQPWEGLQNYVLDRSRGCRHVTLIDPGKQSSEVATRRAIAAIEAGSRMIFVGGSTDTPDEVVHETCKSCLLYTSPSPRDRTRSRMPSSA